MSRGAKLAQPVPLYAEIERGQKDFLDALVVVDDRRSKAEIIREALTSYFSRLPAEVRREANQAVRRREKFRRSK